MMEAMHYLYIDSSHSRMYSSIIMIMMVLNMTHSLHNWTKCENDTLGCFRGECFIHRRTIHDNFKICICEKDFIGVRCERSMIPFSALSKTNEDSYSTSLICLISCFLLSILLLGYLLIYHLNKIVIIKTQPDQKIDNDCNSSIEL